MKVESIREIAIAVDNLDEAIEDFRTKLGLEPGEPQSVAETQARFVSFRVGDCSIGLMESTNPDGPVARFIHKRGEGIYSIAMAVDSIDAATEHLKSHGVSFGLPEPIVMRNEKVIDKVYSECILNFTRPSSLHGVAFEIQELRD